MGFLTSYFDMEVPTRYELAQDIASLCRAVLHSYNVGVLREGAFRFRFPSDKRRRPGSVSIAFVNQCEKHEAAWSHGAVGGPWETVIPTKRALAHALDMDEQEVGYRLRNDDPARSAELVAYCVLSFLDTITDRFRYEDTVVPRKRYVCVAQSAMFRAADIVDEGHSFESKKEKWERIFDLLHDEEEMQIELQVHISYGSAKQKEDELKVSCAFTDVYELPKN